MKKVVFILAALAAMLFISCSGLFDDGTVKKSAGISCTIDAASLAQLPGARAASSSFTIALTMNNSSTGAAIQSVSTTCAPGGTCTLSFDPVATGTKVVFTGTVAYNGTTLGNLSSEEYTIAEGENAITVTITPSYSVSMSVDLSSCTFDTDSPTGSITLTLKNNSDNKTQTKTVTGALKATYPVTFDTAIAAGTSVTLGGYVTYEGKDAYDFIDKTFTVSSTMGTVSLSGYETQSFTYSYNSGNGTYSATITYGFQGAKTDAIPESAGITKSKYFATTIAPDGQIYVIYCSASGDGYAYSLYTNGKLYTVNGIIIAPTEAMKLCKLSDGSFLLYLATYGNETTTKYFYALTPTNSGYDATPVRELAMTITALAATEIDNKQYVFCSGVATDSMPYIPALSLFSVTGTSVTVVWSAAVSLPDTAVYSMNVKITDMAISAAGELYLLLSDSFKTGFLNNGNYYFSSRGALIDAGAASTLAQSSAPSISFSAYGWRGTDYTKVTGSWAPAKNTTLYVYAPFSNDSPYSYFVGPQRFLALTPKKITMADYGFYVSDSQATSCVLMRGTAVFTLSDTTLSFTSSTDTTLYGSSGSSSSIYCCSSYILID